MTNPPNEPEVAHRPLAKIDLASILLGLARRTHAGDVMILSAQLERALEQIIQGHMPNLSNNVKTKLFEGFGPLSTFSAKIDISHAMGLIEDDDRQSLNAVRAIRNKFAHADSVQDFDSPSISTLCDKLPSPSRLTTSNYDRFIAVFEDVAVSLNKALAIPHLVTALRARKETEQQERT